jgi:VanZ family protein
LRAAWLWAPVAGVMGTIFFFSNQPDVTLPGEGLDKGLHFLGYGALGTTLLRAFAGGLPRPIRWKTALAAIAISAAYGVTDEVHQMFVPGRSSELADLAADALGATAAAIGWWACGIIWARRGSGREASR